MKLDVRAIDLTGKCFGFLRVQKPVSRTKNRIVVWQCLCHCGTVKNISGSSLRRGLTKSCGCLLHCIKPWLSKLQTTHGLSGSPTYMTWGTMIQRCTNPKNPKYRIYGARNIHVCERWLKFENFLSDMGIKPIGTTIGRIDNNGNYEPANCRWETIAQQSVNKRTNRRITHQGRTMTVSQWASFVSIKHATLRMRLHRNWSIEKALTP